MRSIWYVHHDFIWAFVGKVSQTYLHSVVGEKKKRKKKKEYKWNSLGKLSRWSFLSSQCESLQFALALHVKPPLQEFNQCCSSENECTIYPVDQKASHLIRSFSRRKEWCKWSSVNIVYLKLKLKSTVVLRYTDPQDLKSIDYGQICKTS